MKKVIVEITKKHSKVELTYYMDRTEEEIILALSDYFEKLKMYLDVVDYRFVSFEECEVRL